MSDKPELQPSPGPAVASDELPEPERAQSTLAGDSARRLSGDVVNLVAGLGGGIISARTLSVDDRGAVGTIQMIVGMAAQLAGLGLGDAAMIWWGQKRASMNKIGPTVTFAITVSGFLLGLVTACVLALLLDPFDDRTLAVAIAAVTCAATTFSLVLGNLASAGHLFGAGARAMVTGSTLTTLSIVLFVAVLKLGVPGAILAVSVGMSASAIYLAVALRRAKFKLVGKPDGPLLRQMLRFGVTLLPGNVLLIAASRFDLVLVYKLAGSKEGGYYANALLLSGLVGLVPLALVAAVFPRIAASDQKESGAVTARAMRATVSLAILGALPVAAIIPFVPFIFGAKYEPSIEMTFLLLPGSILSSCLWTMSRAGAAQGRGHVMWFAWGTTLAVMIALDLVLIGPFGGSGAAIAWAGASFTGLVLTIAEHSRHHADHGLSELLPRPKDFVQEIGSVVNRVRGRSS